LGGQFVVGFVDAQASALAAILKKRKKQSPRAPRRVRDILIDQDDLKAIRADEYEFSSRLPQSPTRATESKARVVRTASAKPSKPSKAPAIDMDRHG
jgi:hypothetical protein